MEALINHFRYGVRPALRSIEVLPYLQLPKQSDSDQMEADEYEDGCEYQQ